MLNRFVPAEIYMRGAALVGHPLPWMWCKKESDVLVWGKTENGNITLNMIV
jgi:hypothetical protein